MWIVKVGPEEGTSRPIPLVLEPAKGNKNRGGGLNKGAGKREKSPNKVPTFQVSNSDARLPWAACGEKTTFGQEG